MSARVAVVDPADRFLRWADREEVHRGRLLHRSGNIMLFDGPGRMVVQRRHPQKRTWPDAWDLAVSGHVEEEDYLAGPDDRLDEVYRGVALREAREELGIDLASTDLTLLGVFPPEDGIHYEQLALFRAVHPGPYTLQADEVAEVRAFTPGEWDAFVAAGARVTLSLSWLIAWARRTGVWAA